MSIPTISSRAAVAIVVTLVALTAAPALAQVDLDYTWDPPTTGSAVAYYIVQHSTDGGTTWTTVGNVTTNNYTLTADYDIPHQIRVAGVDDQDRQGVWSEPSDAYTPDAGAPGAPGKPILF